MRQPARPERLTLLVLVLLAVVVNAAHAASSSPLGWVVAAAPPLVLVVSVELLLRNRAAAHDVSAAAAERERLRIARKERSRRTLTVEPAVPPTAKSDGASGTSDRSPALGAPPTPRSEVVANRLAEVVRWLQEDPAVTGAAVAKRYGLSPSQGRKVFAAARDISSTTGSGS